MVAQELKVAIFSVGETSPKDLAIVSKAISTMYNSQVKILGAIDIEDSMKASYVSPNYHGTPRTEVLKAVDILKTLSNSNEQDKNYDIYIGITNDALITQDNVVQLKNQVIRGLGGSSQKAAVISTYKINLETSNDQDFQKVLSKVVNHEMGHVLGLGHCEDSKQCLMVNAVNFHNSIPVFCSFCMDKIDSNHLKLN